MIEQWVIFRDRETGEELGGYTVRGTFSGEMLDTMRQISTSKGIPADRIRPTLEDRPSKS